MTMNKEMISTMVQDAIAEVEREYKTSPAYICNEFATSDYKDPIEDILAGYDNRYMTRNDYRVAHKIRYANMRNTNSENSLSDDSRFDYLCQQAGLQASKKVKATVKVKSLPKATYLPSKPQTTTTDYVPKNADVNTYTVVDYRIYHKAIVLEIISSDVARNEFLNRESHEVNALTQHIVFRYVPFNRNGQPNPYDGITQLKAFLHSQKFITSQNPTTIRESLEMLKGNTIDLPQSYQYNYSHRSDNLTVYTVFGDFDEFDTQFTNE